MAGRKLTEEERALFAKRLADTRAANQAEKDKKIPFDKSKLNTRSAEQIMSDIEKVKQDPKFQARWQKYLDSKSTSEKSTIAPKTDSTIKTPIMGSIGAVIKTPVGTQPDHHVTDSKNHTKTVK